MKFNTTAKLLLVTVVFAAGGCSSGGGDGDSDSEPTFNESRLVIDDATKTDAAQGSQAGASRAITSSNAPTAAAFGSDDVIAALTAAMRAAWLRNAPAGTETDLSMQVCPDGGSAILTSPSDPPPNGVVSSSWEYIDCMYAVGGTTYTINGTGAFELNQDTNDFSFSYNLTISDGSQTYTVSATYTCTDGGTNCSYSDTFADNGKNYRTTNVVVSGNNTSGYSISATVYIGDLGFVEITGTALTICSNGNIGSGSIQVIDADSNVVMTVDFPDCNTMVITFMGVGETVPQ